MSYRLGLLAWLCSGSLLAGEVLQVSVEHVDRRYIVEVDARFDASAMQLRTLITDYAQLSRINDAIYHSEILLTHTPLQHRVRTEARICVALLCKTIVQVQDVSVLADGNIAAILLPTGSDLSYGVAQWEFLAEDPTTRMRFRSEIEPAFWVPPLIGPWLIQHALQAEARKSVANLERLAEAETP